MITIANIRNVDHANYDEVWAIVRSLRNPGRMKQIAELSPSWNLLKKYMQLLDAGQWNSAAFRDIYVPTFLKAMRTAMACKKIKKVIELDKQGKRIWIVYGTYMKKYAGGRLGCWRNMGKGDKEVPLTLNPV